jgi:hypothetical protein
MLNPGLRFVAALGLVAALLFGLPGGTAARGSEVLASAGFEVDVVGATARPGGPPTVSEEIYDASDSPGGISMVVSYAGGKRYRLSDVGVPGATKGIRLPLSSDTDEGSLRVQAVLTAGQIADGGLLSVVEPEETDWIALIRFGDDGDFVVHDAPSGVPYSPGVRYGVAIDIHFGDTTTVDYAVTHLGTNQTVLASPGHEVALLAVAHEIRFATDAADEGSFTIDDVEATH